MVELKVGQVWRGKNFPEAKVRITYVGNPVIVGESMATGLEVAWNSARLFATAYEPVAPFFEEGKRYGIRDLIGHVYTVTSVFRRHGKMYALTDGNHAPDTIWVALLDEDDYELAREL